MKPLFGRERCAGDGGKRPPCKRFEGDRPAPFEPFEAPASKTGSLQEVRP